MLMGEDKKGTGRTISKTVKELFNGRMGGNNRVFLRRVGLMGQVFNITQMDQNKQVSGRTVGDMGAVFNSLRMTQSSRAS